MTPLVTGTLHKQSLQRAGWRGFAAAHRKQRLPGGAGLPAPRQRNLALLTAQFSTVLPWRPLIPRQAPSLKCIMNRCDPSLFVVARPDLGPDTTFCNLPALFRVK